MPSSRNRENPVKLGNNGWVLPTFLEKCWIEKKKKKIKEKEKEKRPKKNGAPLKRKAATLSVPKKTKKKTTRKTR